MIKILVVDDTPMDQHLVGRLLEKNNDLQAIYASNGKEALDVIAQEIPDIVITDLQMPEMGGLELVQQVRADHSAIPVILFAPMGRAACMAERPSRSTELVISVPMSLSRLLNAVLEIELPDTAAVFAGGR